MRGKNYLIALDIGTTSTKGILYDNEGAIQDLCSLSYQTHYPDEMMVEQDPQSVFRAVVTIVHSLMEKNRVNPKSVSALVFSGILNSMIPVDDSCTPLNRALIWADSRSVQKSEEIRKQLDNIQVKRHTGCTIHPMYFLPRLLWFKEEASEIFKKAHKFISIKEYVLYKLFGDFIVDRSIASGTGIWNMSQMDWDIDLLDHVGVDSEKFSRVVETTYVMKGLRSEFASEMGLYAGTPGVIGASDGPLAHLGSVGLTDDEMSLTVGTGAALRRRLSEPKVLDDAEAWCYYMTENNWLLGGVIQDAGIVMKWFSDTFLNDNNNDKQFELLNRYAEEISPGSEGLFFFPGLGGERCPHYNPHLRGAVLGLSFNHNKKHFIRALMEGISFRLYSVYKMLSYDRDRELVVTGGILKSPTWLQMVSDFFGRRLWKSEVQEASAWGAVLIGLRALGIIDNLEKINDYVRKVSKIEPDMKKHSLYKELYHSYNKVYDGIVSTFS